MKKMDAMDRGWLLTCFGTAVGAGILFLPIQAGIGGFWPALVLAIVAFPVTYVAHRGITRIVASCAKEADIIGAIEHDVGRTAGFAVSILYFLSIVTVCVGYATSITNIADNFITYQLELPSPPRPVLAFILIGFMTAVMLGKQELMVKVTSALTYPLIFLLAVISIYMIPKWNTSVFQHPFELRSFTHNLLILLPLLVFAMNFSPICSTFAAFYRKHSASPEEAVRRSDRILKHTSAILLVFVLFFVFSLLFSTTPEILTRAREGNIDALTAISHEFDEPFLIWMPPIISFLAIASSYFGFFTGTREGLHAIITTIATWSNPDKRAAINEGRLNTVITLALSFLLWALAEFNPSILTILGALSAPIIAIYCYLLPIFLMRRVPRLFIYRSPWGVLVVIVGLVGLLGDFLARHVL